MKFVHNSTPLLPGCCTIHPNIELQPTESYTEEIIPLLVKVVRSGMDYSVTVLVGRLDITFD